MATKVDNFERACDMTLLDRLITKNKMVHSLQISHGSAYENNPHQTWVS